MQAKEKDYKFTSGLSQWIIGFLEEKHRLGYKYEREYFELKNLDRFSIDYNCMISKTTRIIHGKQNSKRSFLE